MVYSGERREAPFGPGAAGKGTEMPFGVRAGWAGTRARVRARPPSLRTPPGSGCKEQGEGGRKGDALRMRWPERGPCWWWLEAMLEGERRRGVAVGGGAAGARDGAGRLVGVEVGWLTGGSGARAWGGAIGGGSDGRGGVYAWVGGCRSSVAMG